MSTPPRKPKSNAPPELTRHNSAVHRRQENVMRRRYEKWLETPENRRNPEDTELFETKVLLNANTVAKRHRAATTHRNTKPYNWSAATAHKGGKRRTRKTKTSLRRF